MRDINEIAKKMARNGLKIANSLGCAFHFESEFSWLFVDYKLTMLFFYTQITIQIGENYSSVFAPHLFYIRKTLEEEEGLMQPGKYSNMMSFRSVNIIMYVCSYLQSLVYRGWEISSNMIAGIVYVGSSRNRYISKLIIYISR